VQLLQGGMSVGGEDGKEERGKKRGERREGKEERGKKRGERREGKEERGKKRGKRREGKEGEGMGEGGRGREVCGQTLILDPLSPLTLGTFSCAWFILLGREGEGGRGRRGVREMREAFYI
jgi:hypothetical protein